MIIQSKNRPESVWSELPLPQIIYEKPTGRIVGCNMKAQSLFGKMQDYSFLLHNRNGAATHSKKMRLSRQRFTDVGLITHKTKDGRALPCRVFRKIVTWNKLECFIDLLVEELSATEPVVRNQGPFVQTEQLRLVHALKEKDVLIKEIHHRIKNNLQMISSILYLKLISFESGEVRNFLEGMRDKIKSISLIHERLLHTGKLDSIDIRDYLTKLLADIQASVSRKDLSLNFINDIHSCTVSSEMALYCGLIVNELVTNAIKYAFADKKEGEVTIVFEALNENGAFMLIVSDNGCGLPEDIAANETRSFGMQLLNIFVQQLEGHIEVIREQGTVFKLKFPGRQH